MHLSLHLSVSALIQAVLGLVPVSRLDAFEELSCLADNIGLVKEKHFQRSDSLVILIFRLVLTVLRNLFIVRLKLELELRPLKLKLRLGLRLSIPC